MEPALHQNAALEAISRIFHEALTCDTEEQLGRVCLAVAEALTGSKLGFICELNAQGLLDEIAISDMGWTACQMPDKTGHGKVPTGFKVQGIYGRVVLHGEGFFTNAAPSHPDSAGVPDGHPPVENFLGVPLVHSGRVIGMVGLANREGGYRAADLAAVEALAPAIVQAFMRRRAEQSLRDSEEQYRSIVETAQEGVVIGGLDGRILFVNQKMADMLGYGRDEIVGRIGLDLMDAPEASAVLRHRATLQDGGQVRGEFKFRRKDGSTLWTLASVSPLRNAAGEQVANLAMHTDITERRQAEQALREAHERATWLARLPGENPNPVMRVSAQGTVLYRNTATQQAPGWACDEGGAPPEPLLPLIQRAMAYGRSVQEDMLLGNRSYAVAVAPFPSERYVNIYVNDITERVETGRALREAKDQLEARVKERTAALDQANRTLEEEVGERRRADERVRAERQRLYDVLETLPVYVILLAPDYRVPFANRYFRERFGESHGRCCFDYLFGRTEPCEICETNRVLKTGASHRWEWTGPDGRDYEIHDFPFKDSDGAPLIMEMGIDITERKRAEAELHRHQDQLERLVGDRTAEIERRNALLVAEIAERERAQEALRKANEERERYVGQLQAVLDHLTEGLVIADLDGRPFHWNPAAVAMHGFAGMDEGLRALPDFADTFELSTTDEGVLPVERWPLARILRGETLRDWEVTLRRHASDWKRVIRYGGTLARDASGEPLLAVLSITDVTERHRSEQALRESREDLNRAQAVAHMGSWRLDVRHNQLLWSDETYRMFGIPPGTPLTYDMFLGCTHPEDRALVDRTWKAALQGEPYDIEHRIVVGDAVRWVRERAEPEIDPDGTLRGGFGTVQDVTERKLAQAALQQAHDTLEERVRARTEELRQVNQTLRMISDCNQALVRATTEDELVHEICRIIQGQGRYRMAWVGYAENDAQETVRPVAWVGIVRGYLDEARISWADSETGRGPTGTCIRTGKVAFGRDFLCDPQLAPWRDLAIERGFRSSIALPLVASGRAFGALTLYAAEPDAFGEEQAILLSELADDLAFGILARRAAVERDHARQVAEERARQLGTLATELGRVEQRERQRLARVLHDHLQQLLVGAKYSLATVEGKVRSRAKQQALRDVTRILDEAIAAASSLTGELSPPALHEKGLAAGLEWLSRQMRQKHGLKVDLRADQGAEPASEQVRFFLFDAVRELLFNVVKHAKVDRALVEITRLGDSEVRVAVSDAGVGFDPESLGSGERASGGFGLFSVRERLSCLGGRMTVESRPRRGSRFTLVAPAILPPGVGDTPVTAAAVPAARPAQLNGGSGGATRRIRVLLADDHAVMRDGLARLLGEQPDIEVVGQASDGQAAIDLARELRPDVVLMDVSMPRIDGVAATPRLVSEHSALRVIGLSMYESAWTATAMREAGAVEYLSKSGPPERVVAAIRAAAASATRPASASASRAPARGAHERRAVRSGSKKARPAKSATRKRTARRGRKSPAGA